MVIWGYWGYALLFARNWFVVAKHALAWQHRKENGGRMIAVMINRILRNHHIVRAVNSLAMSRVGVAVEPRTVGAGDVHPDPVSLLELAADSDQVHSNGINLTGFHQFYFILSVPELRSDNSGFQIVDVPSGATYVILTVKSVSPFVCRPV